MIRDLWVDAIELAKIAFGDDSPRAIAAALVQDSYSVLALSRMRDRVKRYRVLGLNRMLRLAQTAAYGVEIGKDVELGRGVWFVHTVGTVVGGNAKIGNRVRFMGNNTIGTAKDNGYPIIEDDVVIGAGARILGPIRIGARAVIGANAVVLQDIPAGAVAVGVPARVVTSGRDAAALADGIPSTIRATGS